jgi:transcriptional regulator with XRE-family HTH domain
MKLSAKTVSRAASGKVKSPLTLVGHKSLGAWLRAAREERHVTLREVEKGTGISNAQVSQLETGIARNPQLSTFWKLVRFYKIGPDSILKILDTEYGNEVPNH